MVVINKKNLNSIITHYINEKEFKAMFCYRPVIFGEGTDA